MANVQRPAASRRSFYATTSERNSSTPLSRSRTTGRRIWDSENSPSYGPGDELGRYSPLEFLSDPEEADVPNQSSQADRPLDRRCCNYSP